LLICLNSAALRDRLAFESRSVTMLGGGRCKGETDENQRNERFNVTQGALDFRRQFDTTKQK